MARKPATKEYFEYCENLGLKLKEIRTRNGLTQKELSNLTGLPEITIRKYELGKMCPTLYRYIIICDQLRVDPAKFLK